jgi:hypothetical protein
MGWNRPPASAHRRLADGSYRATLSSAAISDPAGSHLDGVGDGVPGTDYTFNFNSLIGDIDGDGKVGFSDLLILARNYGQPGTFSQGDLDGDGNVNFADLLIVARNYGHSLSRLNCNTYTLRRSTKVRPEHRPRGEQDKLATACGGCGRRA